MNCENLSALEVLLENTGGVCLRDGGLVETYLSSEYTNNYINPN